MGTAHVLAGIAWDPQIRGFLALGVGVVVLLGSVYLVMVTNLGSRLGFLLAAAAFWGWLMIMGFVWPYLRHRRHARRPAQVGRPGDRLPRHPQAGRGGGARPRHLRAAAGRARSTSSRATTSSRRARSSNPGLAGWKLLPESNPSFGEAKATVDEYFSGSTPSPSWAIDSAD